ncbi:hypothetical protein MVES1_002941 [Malassezia vespertilionis]|uniref:uncharacterized protein n=1 Tax=Malassezia vespertilionis TaxID=2020962 RepID=UPI0024B26ED2|nr:uncharacterized protein MVES1_002941 [Malassezia vespertilionis]WFD07574.1 hypothetical protein MVES1_002941 [Malassezia vespertilionis]
MKRIAERQIQREDGSDPHAVAAEGADNVGTQERPMRGLPKRKSATVQSPSVEAPKPNPFAGIFAGASSSPFTGVQLNSNALSVGTTSFAGAKPNASTSVSNSHSASSRDLVSADAVLVPSQDTLVEFYTALRGLNWSLIKEFVHLLNKSSDCADYTPLLESICTQYKHHHEEVSRRWLPQKHLAVPPPEPEPEPDAVSATVPVKSAVSTDEAKHTGREYTTGTFSSHQPESTSLGADCATPKSPSSQLPQVIADAPLGGGFSSRPFNARTTGSISEAQVERNLYTETKPQPPQFSAISFDAAAKNASPFSSAKDMSKDAERASLQKNTPKTPAFPVSGGFSFAAPKADKQVEATPPAASHKTDPGIAQADFKDVEAAPKPAAPTFFVPSGGFAFAGTKLSDAAKTTNATDAAPTGPVFDIPKGGFAFAGHKVSAPADAKKECAPDVPGASTATDAFSAPALSFGQRDAAPAESSQKTPEKNTPVVGTTKPITFGSATQPSMSNSSFSFGSAGTSPSSTQTSPHRFSFGTKPVAAPNDDTPTTFTKAAIGPSFANTTGVSSGGKFSFGSAPISFGAPDEEETEQDST